MPKPLIPHDVRDLYETLISEGSRIIPEDDPQWTDPAVMDLLDARSRAVVFIDSSQVTSLQKALSSAGTSIARSCSTGPYGKPKTLPSGEPHELDQHFSAADPDFRKHGGHFLLLCDETSGSIR